MNTIQVYIWGVRYGFTEGTALFPERNRLTEASEIQDYDNICHYFTSAKDVAFRSGQRDFYFLMQDHQYQIYSLVDKSHQDIAGRETYLVYSIVCPKSNIIGGSIKDGLQNLKKLYKTRNADYTIRTNMFTNDQVRSVISNLTLSSGNARSIGNNTVCYFQNESELNLNDYIGDEVYFMQTGSNPELPIHLNLSTQQLNLGQINQENQKRSQSVVEFRALLSAKSNFQKANELYNTVSSALNENERTLFENWKSEMHYSSAVFQLKNLISSFIQNNSTDYSPCENLLAQFPKITNQLTGDEQKALLNWQNLLDNQILTNEKKEIDELVNDINKAEKHEYGIPINAVETRLQKNQLESRLPSDSKIKLKNWRRMQTNSDIQDDIVHIYKEVTTRDRSTILVKQNEWLKTIEGWPKRLNGASPFDKKMQEKYQFLVSKKWVKNEKPIAKIAVMAFVAIALTGGGFFAAMNWDNWFSHEVEGPKDPQPPKDPEPPGPVTPKPAEIANNHIEFPYNGTTYRVEKSLLTDTGSKFGGQTAGYGNGSTYRYIGGKWEMKTSDSDESWGAPGKTDIPFILVEWNKRFKQEVKKTEGEADNKDFTETEKRKTDESAADKAKAAEKAAAEKVAAEKAAAERAAAEKAKTKPLTPAQKAAKFEEIKKEVKNGKCDADCIISKVKEFKFGANEQKQLMNELD